MVTVHFVALNGTKQTRTFKTKRSADLFERRLMRGQRLPDQSKKCTACARAKRRQQRRGGLLRAIKRGR
jgi:dsDNA-binding SOS-regulon protein